MCRHAKRLPVALLALLALLAPSPVVAFSVLSIEGGGASSHLGVAGGADLHIVGTDLGDPFNPPTVLIGNNPNPAMAVCQVRSFTSRASRFHCTVGGDRGLPMQPATSNVSLWGASHEALLTVHVIVDGREAMCDNDQQIDGTGIGDCRVRFDVGGTPLISRVLTPTLSSGELLRVHAFSHEALGTDFDNVTMHLQRGASVVGCPRRDGESEAAHAVYEPARSSPSPSSPLAGDSSLVGCRVRADAFAAAGFFQVRLHSTLHNRGYALVAAGARRIEMPPAGAPRLYDVEVVPRVSSVAPAAVSPAGGATLTIRGSGFGARLADLAVTAAGAPCTPTALTEDEIRCEMAVDRGRTAAAERATMASVGDRGARLEWWSIDPAAAGDTLELATLRALPAYPHEPTGTALLPDMRVHAPCWAERCAGSRLSGWFTAPRGGEYSFMLSADAEAELWCAPPRARAPFRAPPRVTVTVPRDQRVTSVTVPHDTAARP